MKENYNFAGAKKNPYADKLKTGYAVTVHYDFSSANADNDTGSVRDTSKDEPEMQTQARSQ